MEVENNLAENFKGVVDELPDDLKERRSFKGGNNSIQEEESGDEKEGPGEIIDGELEMSRTDGNHHPSGRIIKKVQTYIIIVRTKVRICLECGEYCVHICA